MAEEYSFTVYSYKGDGSSVVYFHDVNLLTGDDDDQQLQVGVIKRSTAWLDQQFLTESTDMKGDFKANAKLCEELSLRWIPKENNQRTEALYDPDDVETTYTLEDILCTRLEVNVLYIIAHGLNENQAKVIGASKGDVLLSWKTSKTISPKQVVEWIRDGEKKNPKPSIIIIIVDSCYSGTWEEEIRRSRLNNTRVLIQTACGADGVSYGSMLIPSFCALQRVETAYIDEVNEIDATELPLQSPTFYDSMKPDKNYSNTPITTVEICGKPLRFFTNPNFFHSFSDASFYDNARGIPEGQIEQILSSFGGCNIQILCCKLKVYRAKPMALILVEWRPKCDEFFLYHLHLHFDDFRNGMELQSLTHVAVKEKDKHRPLIKSKYKYDEVPMTKKHLHKDNTTEQIWKHASGTMTTACKAFIELKWPNTSVWTDEKVWNSESRPIAFIRSRNAILEEMMGKTLDGSRPSKKMRTH